MCADVRVVELTCVDGCVCMFHHKKYVILETRKTRILIPYSGVLYAL